MHPDPRTAIRRTEKNYVRHAEPIGGWHASDCDIFSSQWYKPALDHGLMNVHGRVDRSTGIIPLRRARETRPAPTTPRLRYYKATPPDVSG